MQAAAVLRYKVSLFEPTHHAAWTLSQLWLILYAGVYGGFSKAKREVRHRPELNPALNDLIENGGSFHGRVTGECHGHVFFFSPADLHIQVEKRHQSVTDLVADPTNRKWVTLWVWLTVCHGIDGPNRKFTYEKWVDLSMANC